MTHGERAAVTAFDRDTAVGAVGAGRYSARIDRSWWIIAGPNGGYVAAIVLRAVLAEVADADRRPRSATFHYLRAPAEGAVEVEVTVERAGRTVTNVSARMTQGGRTVVTALVALAVDRDAPVSFDEDPGLPVLSDGSDLPGPEDVAHQDVDPDRDVAMRSHYDMRWLIGDLPFSHLPSSDRPSSDRPSSDRPSSDRPSSDRPSSDRPSSDRPSGDDDLRSDGTARCGGWLRLREEDPVDELVLVAMADAWLPPLFSRVSAPVVVPTVELTVRFRGRPVGPDRWCCIEAVSPVARDGYLVEHARLWDRTGRLLAEASQLAVIA